jgi:tetratricopeptide (TPR) repeat protein
MRNAALALALFLAPVTAVAAQKPVPQLTQQQRLNQLFDDLAKAEDEEDAKDTETQINAMFAVSGSASVDLLMSRSQVALNANNAAVARKLIDAIVTIAPNFAEGWHRLAALQANSKDDRGAMLSLQKTITLNPRHFQAYAELGSFLEDYGDKAGALKMYRKALALDPKMENMARRVTGLARDVEGQGI